ncbi:unnamed protein product [Ambrosiozyma monospora]|uniref:Unnamed protein product n=1 Tax=Ambrosiozyma monospora TaxID=43982 RepID=A0A9W6Z5Z7_AMBMO|nr:unnamed protein product [Ambrosiozyma monospora]
MFQLHEGPAPSGPAPSGPAPSGPAPSGDFSGVKPTDVPTGSFEEQATVTAEKRELESGEAPSGSFDGPAPSGPAPSGSSDGPAPSGAHNGPAPSGTHNGPAPSGEHEGPAPSGAHPSGPAPSGKSGFNTVLVSSLTAESSNTDIEKRQVSEDAANTVPIFAGLAVAGWMLALL